MSKKVFNPLTPPFDLTADSISDITGLQTALDGKVNDTGDTMAGNLGFAENYGVTTANRINFDTTPTITPTAGDMYWNNTDGTVDIRLKGNNVTLQVGQELVTRVVNKTGADLLEAQYRVVRARKVAEGGAQGQRLAVVLAQADSENNSTDVIGVVTENITNNEEGFVTFWGTVSNVDTTGSLQGETWVDGDILYLSPTSAGHITNIQPANGYHLVQVGYVQYAHSTQGKIYVKLDTGYELSELHDVGIITPANDDILQYDTPTGLWKNSSALVDHIADINNPHSVTASQVGAVPTSRTVNSKALSSDITLSLASADFANQGTTTTVLHGNAAGNPSFGAVVEADITLADNTTNNSSAAKHGFLPKLSGNSSQVLLGDGTWGSAGTSSPLTTKGDLYTYSTVNARLPVGTNGQVLESRSTETTGLKWVDPIGTLSFVSNEVPTGTINGSNTAFTLASSPVSGTLKVYLNGQRLTVTNDYTVLGTALTMVTVPQTGDTLLVDYQSVSGTNGNADTLDGQHAPTGTIVGTTDTQTLTNKTLTAPKITGLALCHVYKNGDISLTSSTATKITFDTEVFDVGSNFASNKFTAPSAGYYRIYCHVYFYAGTGSSLQYLWIYKNNAAVYSDVYLPGSVPATSQLSTMIHLDASDYIEFYVQKNAAGWSIYGEPSNTWATIEQISID